MKSLNIHHVSAASPWEISIEEVLGRLQLHGIDLLEEIEVDGFLDLPIPVHRSIRSRTT